MARQKYACCECFHPLLRLKGICFTFPFRGSVLATIPNHTLDNLAHAELELRIETVGIVIQEGFFTTFVDWGYSGLLSLYGDFSRNNGAVVMDGANHG